MGVTDDQTHSFTATMGTSLGHDPDAIEAALAQALSAASQAGEWILVGEIARQLDERRRERTAPAAVADVVRLDARRGR
jgi:hypothetical protein